MSDSALKMILERIGPGSGPENFQMWACRGEGRGCKRNTHRNAAKHCEDCFLPDENETLGDLQKRLKRGDA